MANIDVSNLEPNSHAYKAEKARNEAAQNKEKTKPIISHDQIVSTKKPLSKKFAETFMTEDAKDVKTWLIMDVLIPGLKNTILDVISMMFFGEVDSRSRGSSSRDRGGRTNYRAKYRSSSDRDDRRRREDRYESNDRVDFRHIILQTRNDAEDLVREMKRRIEDTGSVSISELLDMIDAAESSRYTDCNWGWDDPRDVGLKRISSGWLIDVAEPRYLN